MFKLVAFQTLHIIEVLNCQSLQTQTLSRNSLDNSHTQGVREQGRDAEESFMPQKRRI